jgi:hypothetical protein
VIYLHGLVVALVLFILCIILVLGFFIICFLLRVGSWLDYFGQNLSKKGWMGLSPIWGFSRINSLSLVLVYVAIFSVHDITVNVKEDLRTSVNLLLKINKI